MSDKFNPAALTPSYFDDRIAELEGREEELTHELEGVTKELSWLRQGREIYTADQAETETEAELEPVSSSKTTELVPPSVVFKQGGSKPTLRQAILRVMLDRSPSASGREGRWQLADVLSELDLRGWTPGGKNTENIVRHMMGDMVKRGQLARPKTGVYMLAPGMRAGELDAGGDP